MKASEIRLFDLHDGSGAVLVEMPANRRDVQEPSFTPDGQFVCYTQRVIDPSIYVTAARALTSNGMTNGAAH
ncbi:MAG TPA: hypothetical protein VNR40_04480 [Steroidobacter sp.]|nr:hypothetical protein [Steroidobacter sp.]